MSEKENEEKNDFLDLVNKYPKTISETDLKILLEERIKIPSRFLVTQVTGLGTIIVALIPTVLLVVESTTDIIKNPFYYVLISILIFIIVGALTLVVYIEAKQREERELKIFKRYLEAKKKLTN